MIYIKKMVLSLCLMYTVNIMISPSGKNVPINIFTILIVYIYNILGIIAILYSAIVFIVSLCWLILQFCIMINDGNDSLELIFYNGPNYNRDVYFICINN